MNRSDWLSEAASVDEAVYGAIASSDTPILDQAMSRLARAADYSRLSIAAAVLLATARGTSGRRAAGEGMISVAATSVVVNLVIKPLSHRRRPDPVASDVPVGRRVPMPRSRSFPSGHSASAFAFATAVGRFLPTEASGLRGLAALVAYSRVHTGVHYPADVVAGSLLGSAVAQLTTHVLEPLVSGWGDRITLLG